MLSILSTLSIPNIFSCFPIHPPPPLLHVPAYLVVTKPEAVMSPMRRTPGPTAWQRHHSRFLREGRHGVGTEFAWSRRGTASCAQLYTPLHLSPSQLRHLPRIHILVPRTYAHTSIVWEWGLAANEKDHLCIHPQYPQTPRHRDTETPTHSFIPPSVLSCADQLACQKISYNLPSHPHLAQTQRSSSS